MSDDEKEDPPMSMRGQSYFIAESLGEGAYGSVRTVYNDEGNVFAMKAFADDEGDSDEDSDEDSDYEPYEHVPTLELGTLREISVLRMFSNVHPSDNNKGHPNIMPLVDIAEVKGADGMCMLMPRFTCSLDSAIKGKGLTISKKLRVAHRLLCAVAFLHENDIIHRDIKTENILLDDNLQPILADFSLAKLFDPLAVLHGSTHTPDLGTVNYRPPEVCHDEGYDKSADVYSLGVVLLELFHGMLDCDRDKAALAHVQKVREQLGSKPFPTLLKSLLDPDPKKRVTCKDALKSEVFAKMPSPFDEIVRTHSKLVTLRDPNHVDDSKTSKRGQKKAKGKGKKKQKGQKSKGKKSNAKRNLDELLTKLECENPLTKHAADVYHEKSGVPLEHCVVLAAKLYEEELLCQEDVIDRLDHLDFDFYEYQPAELKIFEKMDYCLFV